MKNEIKYYAVKTMCGHVGNGKYLEVTFPIKAYSSKEAAEIARWRPRVKHHNKHAILDIKLISYDEYITLIDEQNNDPFIHCSNKQEQKMYCCDLKSNIKTYIDNDTYIDNSKHKEKALFIQKKNKAYKEDLKSYYGDLCELGYSY
jgi:hypothetical protein